MFSDAALKLGLPTLMPQTQYIVLIDPRKVAGGEDKPVIVSWTAFCGGANASVARLPDVMPRYNMTFAPDAERLLRLREQAVSLGE